MGFLKTDHGELLFPLFAMVLSYICLLFSLKWLVDASHLLFPMC